MRIAGKKGSSNETFSDWMVVGTSYVTLILYAILVIIPVLTVLSLAVSEEAQVLAGLVGVFPRGFQWRSFTTVISSQQFLRALFVSVVVTVSGTVGAIVIGSLTGFALSKKHLPWIKPVLILFIFVMLFNGGIVPNYLVIRSLGMLNTLWSLILPRIVGVFYVLILKSYFETLPESIEESAKLDGASNLRIVMSIVIPTSLPAIATIGLFYTVDYWNSFFDALMYITRPALKPLQLYLREVVRAATSASEGTQALEAEVLTAPESIRAATVILTMIPMLLLYPWLQRYFVKGIHIGSVKG